ncbi:MAG TPA: SRPBCC family protein [Mycobacteriales bacterium]|nr:SRPBCC family protein [Mycobacteriales bacterium]
MSDSMNTASVERVIPAPAEQIFALLADPQRHHEFDGSGTVRNAKQLPERLALGSQFGMSMHLGLPYSMVSTVVEFDPPHRIAWQTWAPGPIRYLVGGRIWRYELEPANGGTLVRESWDISHERFRAAVLPARQKTIEAMTKTLERIEAVLAEHP